MLVELSSEVVPQQVHLLTGGAEVVIGTLEIISHGIEATLRSLSEVSGSWC